MLLDQAGILNAGLGLADLYDHDPVQQAITEVEEVAECPARTQPQRRDGRVAGGVLSRYGFHSGIKIFDIGIAESSGPSPFEGEDVRVIVVPSEGALDCLVQTVEGLVFVDFDDAPERPLAGKLDLELTGPGRARRARPGQSRSQRGVPSFF